MAKTIGQQILQLERAEARDINHGDLRGALQMFDRSFVGFSSTQHKRIRGLGALRRTFVYYRKRAPKLAYHIEQPHVSVNGATAVACGSFPGNCALFLCVSSRVHSSSMSPARFL